MDDQTKNAFSGAESHILTQLGTVRKGLPTYVLNNCSHITLGQAPLSST